jgi:hypothetical protein
VRIEKREYVWGRLNKNNLAARARHNGRRTTRAALASSYDTLQNEHKALGTNRDDASDEIFFLEKILRQEV